MSVIKNFDLMTNFTKLFISTTFIALSFLTMSAQQILHETFDGGIPDTWTNLEVVGNGTASSKWVYTTDGPQGSFDLAPLNSTTASDGWVVFDSDLNCNQGNGQDAWLITPALDVTGLEKVFLSFETYYANFLDAARVRVGTDLNDTENWVVVDTFFNNILLNEFIGVAFGDAALNSVPIRYELTSVIEGLSSNTIYIGFQFLSDDDTAIGSGLEGCAFSWQIDDVIVSSLDQELAMEDPFQMASYGTPTLLKDTFLIASRVANLGTVAKDNVNVDIEIERVTSFQDFTTESVLTSMMSATGPIEPGDNPNLVSDDIFKPDHLETAFYYANYSIQQVDEFDEIERNNRLRTSFQFTEDILSKDNATYDNTNNTLRNKYSATRPQNVNESTWELGNYFNIPDYTDCETFPGPSSDDPCIANVIARNIIFSVGSGPDDADPDKLAHQGETVTLFLYEVAEVEPFDVFDDNDLQAVGFGQFTFPDDATNFDLFTADLTDATGARPQGEGVVLKPNTEYFATVAYTAEMFAPYTANTYQISQISTVVKNGSWFLAGFGKDVTSITRIRVEFDFTTSTSLKAPELADNQLSLFPNPTNSELTVAFELEETSPVIIKMMDATGRILQERRFEKAQTEQFQLEVAQYPVGTYLVNITSDEGVKTKRFTIQR